MILGIDTIYLFIMNKFQPMRQDKLHEQKLGSVIKVLVGYQGLNVQNKLEAEVLNMSTRITNLHNKLEAQALNMSSRITNVLKKLEVQVQKMSSRTNAIFRAHLIRNLRARLRQRETPCKGQFSCFYDRCR